MRYLKRQILKSPCRYLPFAINQDSQEPLWLGFTRIYGPCWLRSALFTSSSCGSLSLSITNISKRLHFLKSWPDGHSFHSAHDTLNSFATCCLQIQGIKLRNQRRHVLNELTLCLWLAPPATCIVCAPLFLVLNVSIQAVTLSCKRTGSRNKLVTR